MISIVYCLLLSLSPVTKRDNIDRWRPWIVGRLVMDRQMKEYTCRALRHSMRYLFHIAPGDVNRAITFCHIALLMSQLGSH